MREGDSLNDVLAVNGDFYSFLVLQIFTLPGLQIL